MSARCALIVAALALCLALAVPMAAEAETALGESNWSMEFGTWLGMDATDYSLAIRRHTGAATAWRLGVEAYFNEATGDGKHTEPGQPAIALERYNNSHNVAFSVQWMKFAQVRDNLAAVFAVGPVLESYGDASRYDYSFSASGLDRSEYKEVRTSYGLGLGLGVEWFFSRRLALGAQTELRGMVGTSTQTHISRTDPGEPTYEKSEDKLEVDLRSIRTAGAKIQLSTYF